PRGATAGGLGAIEGAEQLLSVRPLEANSPIEDRDLRLDVGGPDGDLDGLLRRAVLHGVAKEVLEDQVEVRPVRLDDEVARLAGELDPALRMASLEGIENDPRHVWQDLRLRGVGRHRTPLVS